MIRALTTSAGIITLVLSSAALAGGDDEALVRAIHASPDAPNVDVLVNDAPAFVDLPFTGVTDYAPLEEGTYNIKVVPTGETEPVVIDADLELEEDTTYSVLAVNVLAEIEPLVLIDDNAIDPENARVRFVHASPNAPAVDIALADGGPVLFGNVTFKGVGDYLAVAPGTYDLEARLAGTDTVVLDIPGVMLEAGNVYTAYAMGLVNGEPALQAVLSLDLDGCPGDVVPNGVVDVVDLIVLLAQWGETDDDEIADLNSDGFVDVADLLIVLENWGPCS